MKTLEQLKKEATANIRTRFWNNGEKYKQVETADIEVFLDTLIETVYKAERQKREEEVESFKKVVSYLDSREKVIKELNYPKAMAYDDLKATIKREALTQPQ